MNVIRSKYFYQISHFISGSPENMQKVDENFLRQIEEIAGIQEEDVYSWRFDVYSQYLQGRCQLVDERMGHVLADIGQV
jgi:hypothetical protein